MRPSGSENPNALASSSRQVSVADARRGWSSWLRKIQCFRVWRRSYSGNFRACINVLGLLIAATAISQATLMFPSSLLLYHVWEVKPHIFVSTPEDVIDQDCDPLYNRPAAAGFIMDSHGVVVVDSTNSPMNGRDLLYEIRQRTEFPIRYVINTSAAPDHMLGNEVFSDEQATLVSTTKANAAMKQYGQDLMRRMHGEDGWRLKARMRGFHVTPSTQTFDGEKSLNIDGDSVRIISMLRGEGLAEDAVVFLPAAKVLFLGELFDNHYYPRVGARDVHRWIQVLRQVETWDVDVYVPGHGAPGSRKDVEDFRKFLEWAVAQVEMRVKAGKTWDEVKKELWLPRTYNWHAADLAPDTVADIYRQIAPPPPPPAPSFP